MYTTGTDIKLRFLKHWDWLVFWAGGSRFRLTGFRMYRMCVV